MDKKVLLGYLTLAGLLSGCVVRIDQPVAQATASPPGPFWQPGTPEPGAAPAATSAVPSPQPAVVPVTWTDLGLSGRLVYVTGFYASEGPYNRLQLLDLKSGLLTTLFQAPPYAWINTATVSPADGQILLSYSPPRSFPAIYRMPLDGSQAPQLLFAPPDPNDQYIEPALAPDGKYLYFVHLNNQLHPETLEQRYPIYEIDRMAYPDGQPEKIVDQAYWPRLSSDSSRLVFVSANPVNGTNQLFVADSDGSHVLQVELNGSFIPNIIDAPLFSPDGRSILFSAPGAPRAWAARGLLDWFFGASIASAHGVFSEWWSVPIVGGTPVQLTRLQAANLYAATSPDNRYIASFSSNGVFVMDPDGTGLTMIVPDVGGTPGSVDWIP